MSNSPTGRTRELVRELTASPTLPLLGWTKTVEATVLGEPVLVIRWAIYSTAVTLLWVRARDLQKTVEEVTDAAEGAAESVSGN